MRIHSGWRPVAFNTSLAVTRDGSIEPPGGITCPARTSVVDDSEARIACVDNNVQTIMRIAARFMFFPPKAGNPNKSGLEGQVRGNEALSLREGLSTV